jgi:hypothetical protein
MAELAAAQTTPPEVSVADVIRGNVVLTDLQQTPHPAHEVMRRVIDSQAADQARYIGIERQIEEWNL